MDFVVILGCLGTRHPSGRSLWRTYADARWCEKKGSSEPMRPGHGRMHPNSGFLTIILRYAVLQSLDVPYTTPTGGKLATVTVVVE